MEEPSFTEYFRDGEWRQLFDNERLQYLTTYSMGKKYGLYEEWTINKELVQRGYYEYDLMSALWTYVKNDSVVKYEVYDADSIIDGFVYEYYDKDTGIHKLECAVKIMMCYYGNDESGITRCRGVVARYTEPFELNVIKKISDSNKSRERYKFNCI